MGGCDNALTYKSAVLSPTVKSFISGVDVIKSFFFNEAAL
jgi:hypothetical protein